jgi:hypothetical protein
MPFTFPCRRGDAEFNAFGDLLTTLSGEAMPIQWIGRRVYKRSTESSYPESVLPVRVARGALGPDAPRCDLFISQHHGLWVAGLLIQAIDPSKARPPPLYQRPSRPRSSICT